MVILISICSVVAVIALLFVIVYFCYHTGRCPCKPKGEQGKRRRRIREKGSRDGSTEDTTEVNEQRLLAPNENGTPRSSPLVLHTPPMAMGGGTPVPTLSTFQRELHAAHQAVGASGGPDRSTFLLLPGAEDEDDGLMMNNAALGAAPAHLAPGLGPVDPHTVPVVLHSTLAQGTGAATRTLVATQNAAAAAIAAAETQSTSSSVHSNPKAHRLLRWVYDVSDRVVEAQKTGVPLTPAVPLEPIAQYEDEQEPSPMSACQTSVGSAGSAPQSGQNSEEPSPSTSAPTRSFVVSGRVGSFSPASGAVAVVPGGSSLTAGQILNSDTDTDSSAGNGGADC